MADRRRGAHIKMIEGSHFPGDPFSGGVGKTPQAPGVWWLCSLIGDKRLLLCLEELRGGGVVAGIAPAVQAEPLVCALLIPWVRGWFLL